MPNNKIIKTAQSLYIEHIRGNDLDEFLGKGWYRMGPSIFTSHYIYYQEELFSVVWLRTVLKNYKLSKSLRKLSRKNSALYTHSIEPYFYSDDLEELYQAYKKTFKGDLPESLTKYMMDSLGLEIYDTRLVKVYDGKQLIACSIFDVGKKTIASIFGFYKPEYSAMSMGLYTMILEIEFCQEHQMDFYYVGYFVPGNPRFDYKLRLGHIEYLDMHSGTWEDSDTFSYDHTPLAVTKSKLSTLLSRLDKKHKATLYKNAYIDVHMIEYFAMNYVEEPLLVIFEKASADLDEHQFVVCTYDVRSERYKLLLCQVMHPGFSNYNPEWIEKLDDLTYKDQLVATKTLKKCKTIAPVERWLDNAQLLFKTES